MEIISEKDFARLADFKNDICISIYLPTDIAGKEVLEGKSAKHLKTIWRDVVAKLEKMQVAPEKINKFSEEVQQLLIDKDFWRHQSQALAIFIADNVFQKFNLPEETEEIIYINKEFYLKPLIPLLSKNVEFYLLALQLESVKLFKANRFKMEPVTEDLNIPARLEDAVGYDYEQKSLQFRGGSNQDQNNMQGYSAPNDKRNETLRYFRAIDHGLHDFLKNKNLPLVISCQEHLFSIYKEANTYEHFYENPVPGNPAANGYHTLHQKAWKSISPHFYVKKEEKLKKFSEYNQTGKTSVLISDIIPAIFEGKVDTLFLENNYEVWGHFNEEKMKVDIHEEQNSQNTSLTNWAAKKVLSQGGLVFLMDRNEMPETSSGINALYRYN